jgi:SAM-dependent methyltransferase
VDRHRAASLVPAPLQSYARRGYRKVGRYFAPPAQNPLAIAEFEANYGSFHTGESFEHLAITGLDKPSGAIRGSIVHFCGQLPRPKSVLLPGEPGALRSVYATMLGVDDAAVVTAGLMPDADFTWNFEQDPPEMGHFDLILSQAMLEHLIDPYKHMRDLARLLDPGGHLIVHTHVPGFKYHRFPIDCQRFFPDWFEGVAERASLDVVDKFIGEQRILYVMGRPATG